MSEFWQNNLRERIEKSQYVFRGRIFEVELAQIELPDHSKSSREIVHHHGGASILALDEADNVYLVEQYRISVDQELLEIPAGKLEEGETHTDCARRELYEELGIKANQWELLSRFYPTPGYCSEEIQVFLARDLTLGKNQLDPGEFLRVHRIPLEEALQMIRQHSIRDAKTIVALLMVSEKLAEERHG